MDRVTDDAVGAGLGMDLSVIAQLRGDKPTGLAIQRDSLNLQRQVFSDRDTGAPHPCVCWHWRRHPTWAPTRP